MPSRRGGMTVSDLPPPQARSPELFTPPLIPHDVIAIHAHALESHGIGAWGLSILTEGGRERTFAHGQANTTRQVLEFHACAEALSLIREGQRTVIVTEDALLAGEAENFPKRIACDYRDRNGDPIPHERDWRRLDGLLLPLRRDVSFALAIGQHWHPACTKAAQAARKAAVDMLDRYARNGG